MIAANDSYILVALALIVTALIVMTVLTIRAEIQARKGVNPPKPRSLVDVLDAVTAELNEKGYRR